MRTSVTTALVAVFATHANAQACRNIGTRSMACGVGQMCVEYNGGFACQCDYPLSNPDTGINRPAVCSEEIPTKYISWVTGNNCPFDEHTQCMMPPNKARCEKAARKLGFIGSSASATLENDDSKPTGCHFNNGASSLHYNPSASYGTDASPSDSLICECEYYPMYVPTLRGAGCGTLPGSCHPVESRFECALAADLIGFALPAQWTETKWNTTLCTTDPNAGPGSALVPCGSQTAVDCSDPDNINVRRCRFVDNFQEPVELQEPTGLADLDGCTYRTSVSNSSSESPLWFFKNGDEFAQSTSNDFRLCDCTDESQHSIIAPRLGFAEVGDGDCSKGAAPGNTCAGQPNDTCVVRADNQAVLRADRLECTSYDNQVACEVDAEVCKWDSQTGACQWIVDSFAYEGEVPAFFSVCLEHCLLMWHCDGVSFFLNDGTPDSGFGGCDFFTGAIVDVTGETTKPGRGFGRFKCYRNLPDRTPAPATNSPTGIRIPPPGPPTTAAPQNNQGSLPTLSPTRSPSTCPVGLSIESPSEVDCECSTYDCVDAKPFSNSSYEFCGRCDNRLVGATQFRCPVCVPVDTQMNISCPNTYEACDVLLYVYQQPGCSSTPEDSVNGGFVDTLPGLGYTTSSRCSPSFCGNSTCQDTPDYRHRTVAFHKQIAGGETEELPKTATDPTMYFTIVVSPGRICSTLSQESCETGPGLCVYNEQAQVCEVQLCPPAPITAAQPRPLCCMLGTPGGDCNVAESY